MSDGTPLLSCITCGAAVDLKPKGKTGTQAKRCKPCTADRDRDLRLARHRAAKGKPQAARKARPVVRGMCRTCGQSTSDRNGPGVSEYCSKCKAERVQELARAAYRRRNAAKQELRICPCGVPAPRTSNYGPSPKYCPECLQRIKGERLAAHYEALRSDPEAWASYLEECLPRSRQWREENADHVARRDRAYRQANRHVARESKHRRRARHLAAYVAPVNHEQIWIRDSGVCQLCCEPIDPELKWPHPLSRTLDHVVPLMLGGTHEPSNVQLAHARCNISKGARFVA